MLVYKINILGNTGQGSISGNITNSIANAKIKSLSDIEVLLLDENNNPKAVTYTDVNGNFSFLNLAYDTYRVYAEYAGYQCIPVEVTLNSNNSSVNSVQLMINNNITGTVEYGFMQSDLGEIYPSPAAFSKNVHTMLRLKQDAEVSVSMIDISGKVIFTLNQSYKKGVHVLTIPVENINEGVYFLNVVSSDGTVNAVKKFIK